jgi:hypothetical protein
MSNKLSAVLILCMSTALAGCDLLRVAGPCYGVGCPSGTAGGSGQYKPGEAPKPQNASAPVPSKSATAPNQSASTAAQPNDVQPNAPAQAAAMKSPAVSATTQPTSAQVTSTPPAVAQPTPAQEASTETKPSPFHAIGEFFERLIPHHSSGANAGASSGAGN